MFGSSFSSELSTADSKPIWTSSSPTNRPFVSDSVRQPGAVLRMRQLAVWEMEFSRKGILSDEFQTSWIFDTHTHKTNTNPGIVWQTSSQDLF